MRGAEKAPIFVNKHRVKRNYTNTILQFLQTTEEEALLKPPTNHISLQTVLQEEHVIPEIGGGDFILDFPLDDFPSFRLCE